ncbi:MAG TPA: glycogen synthase GlgA [Syntrophorhabdaceae bacterium]|nr:glycogen synthase GlgA [Syntrophorhabdaceae bacterium]HOL05582.1 glycogen synthase GlgA [Syntrophorhabdaceae bacterium]HPP41840.1 glycogen synthase GlgA [Syntrophorhabdaceae bacterium]
MKILIASPEVYPFIKTGGLADVSGALPKALKKLGVDVRVILPKHKGIDEQRFTLRYKNYRISCPISLGYVDAEIVESEYDGITAYLVEQDDYYNRDYLYSTPDGDYQDNAVRFIFFSKSILEAIKVTGYIPDVLHCNDWETALAPVFLRTLYRDDPDLKDIATLFTIHNIGYQGIFWHHDMHLLNIGWEYFTPDYLEFYGNINFLKGGIVFSDIINTVSKQYSQEIQTPEFGYGLDGVLRSRKSDLFGIVNGIDYEDWNPEKDNFLPANYSPEKLENKAICKKALLKEFGLPYSSNKPVIATISRLADQKGFDLIALAMEEIFSLGAQYIVLGTGERKYHELFTDLAKRFNGLLGVKIAYDNRLAHLIEAGADMFLMPSRYEPCGLNQLYSLKYGTVPIVRGVGGLEDTIIDYTMNPGQGTGFKFYEYNKEEMLDAIERAMAVYENKSEWQSLIKRCMNEDFSWEKSAREYIELYNKAIAKHRSMT